MYFSSPISINILHTSTLQGFYCNSRVFSSWFWATIVLQENTKFAGRCNRSNAGVLVLGIAQKENGWTLPNEEATLLFQNSEFREYRFWRCWWNWYELVSNDYRNTMAGFSGYKSSIFQPLCMYFLLFESSSHPALRAPFFTGFHDNDLKISLIKKLG